MEYYTARKRNAPLVCVYNNLDKTYSHNGGRKGQIYDY